jgi:hypothetical protein
MALAGQILAQDRDALLAELNQPFEKSIEYTLDTMFKGQDTLFVEQDSFILFYTPDMIRGDLDTLEYGYNETSSPIMEWDHNGDKETDLIGVVYLADKRTGEPMKPKSRQYLIVGTNRGEDGMEVSYFEKVIPCHVCGMGGGEPDISLMADDTNKLEIVEVRGSGDMIYNVEYHTTFEAGALLVHKYIRAEYHEPSGSLWSETMDYSTMMELDEYENENQDEDNQQSRIAIFPAEFAKGIKVDGKLDEPFWNREAKLAWRPLHATLIGEKHTLNDLFGKYSLAWDHKNLYLSVKVKDEKLVPLHQDGDELKGDYVRAVFDFNNFKIQGGKLLEKPNDRTLPIIMGFDKYGKPYLIPEKGKLKNAELAFGRVSGGYNLELRIPKAELLGIMGKKTKEKLKDGSRIGFTVAVYDSDNRETSELENIDASSRAANDEPYKMGRVELYKEFRLRTFEEVRNQ